MKLLIGVAIVLFIIGGIGLSLASNLNYMPEQEALTYLNAGEWMPYQSVAQQQFNFICGVTLVSFGIMSLALGIIIRLAEK